MRWGKKVSFSTTNNYCWWFGISGWVHNIDFCMNFCTCLSKYLTFQNRFNPGSFTYTAPEIVLFFSRCIASPKICTLTRPWQRSHPPHATVSHAGEHSCAQCYNASAAHSCAFTLEVSGSSTASHCFNLPRFSMSGLSFGSCVKTFEIHIQ